MTYIDEVEERCAKATSGPWLVHTAWSEEDQWYALHVNTGVPASRLDLLFITRSRTDVPELCARLRRAISEFKEERGRLIFMGSPEAASYWDDLVKELEAPLTDTRRKT